MRRLPVLGTAVFMAVGLLLTGCPAKIGVVNDVTTHHFGVVDGEYETEWAFQVFNATAMGGSTLVFAVSADQPWILLDRTGGTSTGPDDPQTVTVTIDRAYAEAMKEQGFASGRITIAAGGNDCQCYAGECERYIDVTTAPDYFTYILSCDQDLNDMQIALVPTGGPSFYRQEANAIAGFPTDPTGGLVLDFNTWGDPIMAGLLFDGETVPFYGVNYDTLYISSEGWVSFGEPGVGSDDVGEHFATKQIAGFPVDATVPGSQVSYLQEQDRLVITYENAPTAGGVEVNDFQIEMLFNGDIRLNYVNVDACATGVIGLSSGAGQNGEAPPDFIESELNTDTVKVALD